MSPQFDERYHVDIEDQRRVDKTPWDRERGACPTCGAGQSGLVITEEPPAPLDESREWHEVGAFGEDGYRKHRR